MGWLSGYNMDEEINSFYETYPFFRDFFEDKGKGKVEEAKDHPLYDILDKMKSEISRIDPEEFRSSVEKRIKMKLIHGEVPEEAVKEGSICNALKILVINVLKHKDWTINDVKFSDKGNLESINIKFASEFTLGNSPWDPR